MILVASCKTQKSPQLIDTENALISISKGRCLGKCPVYDLWVFKNGNVIYNGIDNVEKLGVQEATISLAKIDTLEKLITNININDLGAVKGRDKPLTILRYNNKKYVFQTSKIKGNILKINNLMKDIQLLINKK